MGEKLSFSGTQPFEVISDNVDEDRQTMTISLKAGNTSNDILKYLIPKVEVNMLQEVIPSMNEVFIKTVNQKSA